MWCDHDILCDVPRGVEPVDLEETEPLLAPTHRQIFVDPATRTIEGLAYYRLYEPATSGWELLAGITIRDDWDGESQDWSYFEASMVMVGRDQFIDRGAYFDADGCGLKVPGHVELTQQMMTNQPPFPRRWEPLR